MPTRLLPLFHLGVSMLLTDRCSCRYYKEMHSDRTRVCSSPSMPRGTPGDTNWRTIFETLTKNKIALPERGEFKFIRQPVPVLMADGIGRFPPNALCSKKLLG